MSAQTGGRSLAVENAELRRQLLAALETIATLSAMWERDRVVADRARASARAFRRSVPFGQRLDQQPVAEVVIDHERESVSGVDAGELVVEDGLFGEGEPVDVARVGVEGSEGLVSVDPSVLGGAVDRGATEHERLLPGEQVTELHVSTMADPERGVNAEELTPVSMAFPTVASHVASPIDGGGKTTLPGGGAS